MKPIPGPVVLPSDALALFNFVVPQPVWDTPSLVGD